MCIVRCCEIPDGADRTALLDGAVAGSSASGWRSRCRPSPPATADYNDPYVELQRGFRQMRCR